MTLIIRFPGSRCGDYADGYVPVTFVIDEDDWAEIRDKTKRYKKYADKDLGISGSAPINLYVLVKSCRIIRDTPSQEEIDLIEDVGARNTFLKEIYYFISDIDSGAYDFDPSDQDNPESEYSSDDPG